MQQQGIPPALTEVSTRPSSIMSQRAGEADPCKRYGQGRGRQHHERVAGGRPWPSERSFVEALAAFVKAIPEVDPKADSTQCLCARPMAMMLAQSFSAQVADVAAALHRMRLCAEVRAWFPETQQVQQSTLRLKLRVLHLDKRSPTALRCAARRSFIVTVAGADCVAGLRRSLWQGSSASARTAKA